MTIRIRITGWADYNPRPDLKSVSWVRIESNIATSRKLFGLTAEEKWFWIYLLSLAGEQNKNGQIDATLDYLAHFSVVSKPHVLKALENLETCGLIAVDRVVTDPRTNPNESVLITNELATNERNERDERNGTNEIESASADAPSSPAQFLFKLWNAHRGQLPACRKLTEPLRRKAKARWEEEPDPAYWETCVKKLRASKFCLEGGWASFHWLMKNEDNHAKVAAGNYDNKDGAAADIDWDKVFEEPRAP